MIRNNFKIFWSSRSHNYTAKEIKYVTTVLKKADPLTKGFYLENFEKKFKKYLNCKGRVFGVTSGASAIELAAALLKLRKGDEVIVPAHTYCATVLPFCRYGARIRWADINLDTMTIDINHVKRLINYKTKIISSCEITSVAIGTLSCNFCVRVPVTTNSLILINSLFKMNLISSIFFLSKSFVCGLNPICDTVNSTGKVNSPEKINFPSTAIPKVNIASPQSIDLACTAALPKHLLSPHFSSPQPKTLQYFKSYLLAAGLELASTRKVY